MEPAGRVHQHHVASGLRRVAPGTLRELQGRGLFGRAFIYRQLDIARDHRELLASCRAVNVHRHHLRTVAVFRKVLGKFARGGRLARSLQSDDHDHAWRLVREPQLRGVRAEHLDQLVSYDFDDLLGRRQGLEHVLSHRLSRTPSMNCLTTLK